jgi:hypothetical protein
VLKGTLALAFLPAISIVRYLVGQGIQFHTWKATPTTPRAFCLKNQTVDTAVFDVFVR